MIPSLFKKYIIFFRGQCNAIEAIHDAPSVPTPDARMSVRIPHLLRVLFTLLRPIPTVGILSDLIIQT